MRRPIERARAAWQTRARPRIRSVDLFVAALVLIWWLVGPISFDDGWVKVRQTNYDYSSGFSNYYTAYGTNLPLDYWLEWVQRWIVGSFDNVLVLRLPAVALILLTWLVCRSIFGRVAGNRPAGASAGLWAVAVVFVLNALSWDMTLRPEPVIAFLLVTNVYLAVQFIEKPRAGPLVLSALVATLAFTAHPAGLITLASLLAISPRVVDWVRRTGITVPVVMLTSSLALLLTLVSLGSDIAQRRRDARDLRIYGDADANWRDELSRYTMTSLDDPNSPMRRMSVALLLVVVLAYLFRRVRGSHLSLDLPGICLVLALFLLIPTPSKWIWHFGALAGLAALAAGAEVASLRARAEARWASAPFGALVAAILIVAWAWSPRVGWGVLDLRTVDWHISFEDRLPLALAAASIPVGAVAALMLTELLRHGRGRLALVPWRFTAWLAPLVVLPVIAFTIVMLVVDAARTPSWTFARQNVESLAGREGCALGDDTITANPRSMVPLPAQPGGPWELGPRELTPTAALAGLDAFTMIATSKREVLSTPWYPTPPREEGRIGFFLSGVVGSNYEGFYSVRYGPPEVITAIEVRWGRRENGITRVISSGRGIVDEVPTRRATTLEWTFLPEGRMPKRPRAANAVRLLLHVRTTAPRAMAVTGAIRYRTAPLRRLVSGSNARALVWPNLVMYLPCARLPRLSNGIVDVPSVLVTPGTLWHIELETSPFRGALDVYRLRDLSVGDSKVEPKPFNIYWLDTPVRGGALAPAQLTVE